MATKTTPNRSDDNKPDKTDVLADARAKWDRAFEREEDNQRSAYESLGFLAGDQWPDQQKKEREDEDRPVLTVNRLPQFVNQITGDIRQMKPAIKVVPVDNEGDEKLADLRGGMVRYIENRSDASAVYFRGADSQVACGVGAWRIITEYDESNTHNQEIRIAPIEDGIAVLWDPDSSLPDKSDANYCFVPADMSRASFEESWPDSIPSDFDSSNWNHISRWITDDYVRVAEFWLKKPAKIKLAYGLDGSIVDVTDADQDVIAYHASRGARLQDRESYKVCRYLISATEVLEGPIEWPGRHIPIVSVVGREIRIGRKVIRKGIVQDAMDPQRMSNYYHSAHTETVALQPKAPFMVTEFNVAKYQDLWEQANKKNLPYLIFEPDPKNGGTSPGRIQPPVSSQGIVDGLKLAGEGMKGVIGIYDAGLGNTSNETSGKAIMARQREGDVGSFVFIDNFTRAIRRTGQILVDLIPKIYDTERTIRIMGEDGRIDVIEINKARGTDPATGGTIYDNDLSVGAYDVVATIGPSYTTKREEAKEGMNEFIRSAPGVANLILDLYAKAQDWPMADEIGKRVRTQLPPQIIAMEEAEKQGVDPEQAMKMAAEQMQPPPDPKVMEIQGRLEMDAKRLEMDAAKAASDQDSARISAELEAAKLEQQGRLKLAELEQNAQLERERMRLDAEVRLQIAEIQFNAKMADAGIRAETSRMAAESRANGDERRTS